VTATEPMDLGMVDAPQWRLVSMQAVNWGSLDGYHHVDFDEGATLISGGSGVGKSTLLDAWLALIMPPTVPFNGASNDIATGRARGKEQRNLVTYLRGLTGSVSDSSDGSMLEKNLRGNSSATWGALSATFEHSNGKRYTLFRAYFVPTSARTASDIVNKMGALDGNVDLRDLEPAARERMETKAIRRVLPGASIYKTYAQFSAEFCSALSIGDAGSGENVLRLLARIQGGYRIRGVDELFKDLVLEQPATYEAADRALEHYGDLVSAHQQMKDAQEQMTALSSIEDNYKNWESGQQEVDILDEVGVTSSDEHSPARRWETITAMDLASEELDDVEAVVAQHEGAVAGLDSTIADLDTQLAEVEVAIANSGGDAVEQLQARLQLLTTQRSERAYRLESFTSRTNVLGRTWTQETFTEATQRATGEIDDARAQEEAAREAAEGVSQSLYELRSASQEITAEIESLRGRNSLIAARDHDARVQLATAAGLRADDVPFLAELVDVKPDQERWRTAIELVLRSVAMVALVDDSRLDDFSDAIDSVRVPRRVRFEGVTTGPRTAPAVDEDWVSGKVVVKDGPFAAAVWEKLTSPHIDALCVDSPTDLAGGGRRVTESGQTRDGRRGAHGGHGQRPILGFSNQTRIRELASELKDLQTRSAELTETKQQHDQQAVEATMRASAWQAVLETRWPDIDVASLDTEMAATQENVERLLAGNDVLAELRTRKAALKDTREQALEERGAIKQAHRDAQKRISVLQVALEDLDRRYSQAQALATREVSEAQDDYLTTLARAAGMVEGTRVETFHDSVVPTMRRTAAERIGEATRRRDTAATNLKHTFESFSRRWPDPNRGVGVESYGQYLEILDHIRDEGLPGLERQWRDRIVNWTGTDLVPLNHAYSAAMTAIEERLEPINAILERLPFGARHHRLKLVSEHRSSKPLTEFRARLRELSSGATQTLTTEQAEIRYEQIKDFMSHIAPPELLEPGQRVGAGRDYYLDVRRHLEITARELDTDGVEQFVHQQLTSKSGGETQELVAFIVGSALLYQLKGDVGARPTFAPVLMDEGFIKSDAAFAGRAIQAWRALGFQLVVAAPEDKYTGVEPHIDRTLMVTKNTDTGRAFIRPLERQAIE